jgi:hypothetical protein
VVCRSDETLIKLLRSPIALSRVGFGRFASPRLRRGEPSPKLRFRSSLAYRLDMSRSSLCGSSHSGVLATLDPRFLNRKAS